MGVTRLFNNVHNQQPIAAIFGAVLGVMVAAAAFSVLKRLLGFVMLQTTETQEES